MTNDEYLGALRARGWTVVRVTHATLVRSLLLQGKDGDIAMIAHPDDLDASDRSEKIERFLAIYADS